MTTRTSRPPWLHSAKNRPTTSLPTTTRGSDERVVTTVGILGGGQLARMLALSGAPLGLRFLVMDTADDACAGQFSPMVVGDYRDEAALGEFASRIDVATFDFENVPAESAQWLSERVPVFPSPRALGVAQDRLAEKSLFRELGIPVPPFAAIATRAELDAAIATIGTPCILKTRRLGYDGKGQFRLKSAGDADAAWDVLGAQATTVGLILEGFIAFERELSVVAVRGRDGEFRTWPLTENWHVDGVLSASLAPASVSDALAATAFAHAQALAEALDYVGVFALELFCRDGELLANELAPRVHNSGHWTIEGSETSQFQNHLRAVLGLPLGATRMLGHACMLNWIGVMPDADAVLGEAGGHWHDYGKSPRAGRKVGHATLRADSTGELAGALKRVGAMLGRDDQVTPVIATLGS
jgi:5-(carboxyamino)imidazole ribonucleotide synthase